MNDSLVIDRKFNGPPASANGGYSCGVFAVRAEELIGTSRILVALHSPPPLDTALRVEEEHRRVHFWHDDTLVASAAPTGLEIGTVGEVSAADAAAARGNYYGRSGHPFPTCFVCGPRVDRPDGLALTPGVLAGSPNVTACVWRPSGSPGEPAGSSVSAELTWAALDCPGGWTADLTRTPMVLGRMTARLDALPRLGETYVVTGRLDARRGRTMNTTTTLRHVDGTMLGGASAVWVEI